MRIIIEIEGVGTETVRVRSDTSVAPAAAPATVAAAGVFGATSAGAAPTSGALAAAATGAVVEGVALGIPMPEIAAAAHGGAELADSSAGPAPAAS